MSAGRLTERLQRRRTIDGAHHQCPTTKVEDMSTQTKLLFGQVPVGGEFFYLGHRLKRSALLGAYPVDRPRDTWVMRLSDRVTVEVPEDPAPWWDKARNYYWGKTGGQQP